MDGRVRSAQIAEVAVHSMFIWEKISFCKCFAKWKDGEKRFFSRYGEADAEFPRHDVCNWFVVGPVAALQGDEIGRLFAIRG